MAGRLGKLSRPKKINTLVAQVPRSIPAICRTNNIDHRNEAVATGRNQRRKAHSFDAEQVSAEQQPTTWQLIFQSFIFHP